MKPKTTQEDQQEVCITAFVAKPDLRPQHAAFWLSRVCTAVDAMPNPRVFFDVEIGGR